MIIGIAAIVLIIITTVLTVRNNCRNVSRKKNIPETENYLGNDGTHVEGNELYVIAKDGISEEEVSLVAKKYDASMRTEMADVGIYLFIFGKEMNYDELEGLRQKIDGEECIEKADFNYAFEVQGDR